MMRKTVEDGAQAQREAEEFAQKIKMSKDEYDALVERATKEMEARKIPEESLDFYIYRRTLFALKQRGRAAGSEAEGPILGVDNLVDFSRKPLEEAREYVKNEGQRLAISLNLCDKNLTPVDFYVDPNTDQPTVPTSEEEEDELVLMPKMSPEELEAYIVELGQTVAKQNKRMDEDGDFLFPKGHWNEFKKIPEHDYRRRAIGLMKLPNEDEPKLSDIMFFGDAATQEIPLNRVIKVPVSVSKQKTTANLHALNVNKKIISVGEEVEIPAFDEIIKKGAPDKRLSSIDGLENFLATHEAYDWCIIDADITEVSSNMSKFGSYAVTVASPTISIQGLNDEVTFWVGKDKYKGLTETSDAIIVVKPKKKNDGTITGDLIGYYIDPLFRPFDADEYGDDMLNPF